MNIVLYTNSFLPKIGGRELVVHHLARTLHELGHEVRVLGPAGWWRLRKCRYEYPVYRYPVVRGRLRDPVRLVQLLLDTTWRRCDLIHAHITYPAGYIAGLLKRIRDIPLVLTPHGIDIHTIPELGHGLRLDPRLRDKIDYAVRKADAVTAISASIEQALIAAGAEPSKLHRIGNGVDLDRFAAAPDVDVHAWLGVPREARLLVTVGNYHPRKGQETLIRAMPLMLGRAPEARLIIVGRNTEKLTPLIDDLGLAGKVILTGQLKLAELGQAADTDWLAALYARSAMYLSAGTSEGAEGLSLALLEAMAAGLPVVATDISGNRDVVTDGVNGYLVPPGSEEGIARRVSDLLAQEDMRTAMGRRARETAAAFSWRSVTNRYLELYREIIGMHAKRSSASLRN